MFIKRASDLNALIKKISCRGNITSIECKTSWNLIIKKLKIIASSPKLTNEREIFAYLFFG